MMSRALLLLRPDLHYRRDAFAAGLEACGFRVERHIVDPKPDDVVVMWNRYGDSDVIARQFEQHGARVLVTENGWLGKDWRSGQWFTLCEGHHAGAGSWPVGDDSRWDDWNVELGPWKFGREKLILAQRGIGEAGIAAPLRWAEITQAKVGGRIRQHPGKHRDQKPLEYDLRGVGSVYTYNSGAALKALAMGYPVRCAFDRWIGRLAATGIDDGPLNMDSSLRLAMFRRLAWSMWTLEEIESGRAIEWCLKLRS